VIKIIHLTTALTIGRTHRWLRGDWQIAGWFVPYVPGETVARVPNPISVISWWEDFRYLRRSLVEPANLLPTGPGGLCGQAWKWTLVALCILFLPTWVQFGLNLVKAALEAQLECCARCVSVLHLHCESLLTVVFVAHQTMLALDAVYGRWSTVCHAESNCWNGNRRLKTELKPRGRTSVDVCLQLDAGSGDSAGGSSLFVRPQALPAALPLLVLWLAVS